MGCLQGVSEKTTDSDRDSGNEPLFEPTVQNMETAVAYVSRAYGGALSLEDLKVALMLSNVRNGTKMLLSEVLRGWY